MTEQNTDGIDRTEGEMVKPGRVRIESVENSEAWIEAEYRDGWAEKKLFNDNSDAYAEMTHPFYLRCTFCKKWDAPQLWAAGSNHCPDCEQWHDFVLPALMGRLFDNKRPVQERQETGVIGDE